jgi:hypothetical protein
MKCYYGSKFDEDLKEIIYIPWVLYAIGEKGEFNYADINELENETIRNIKGTSNYERFNLKIIEVPDDYIVKFNNACFNGKKKKSWKRLNMIIDFVLESVEDIHEKEYNKEWWEKGEPWDENLE